MRIEFARFIWNPYFFIGLSDIEGSAVSHYINGTIFNSLSTYYYICNRSSTLLRWCRGLVRSQPLRTVQVQSRTAMDNEDPTQTLENLSTYQTNKDQNIGSIIAKAASKIAHEARLRFDPDDATECDGTKAWTPRAQPQAKQR